MNELLWWFGQNTLAALLMIPCVMLACRLFRDRPAGALAMAFLAVIALPYWSMVQPRTDAGWSVLDRDEDFIVVGSAADLSAKEMPSPTLNRFITAKPKQVTFASSGSSEILNDQSVQFNQTDRWQEFTLHFSPADLPSKISVVQLEILPGDSAPSNNSKPPMLVEVKPYLKQQDGKTIQLEFSKCTFTGDSNDDSTANCIDSLSDTGWKVPEFTDTHRAHILLLHLEKPIETGNLNELAITIDAGCAGQFAALSRVRVSFADAMANLPDTDEKRWLPGTRRTIAVNDVSFSFRWCPPDDKVRTRGFRIVLVADDHQSASHQASECYIKSLEAASKGDIPYTSVCSKRSPWSQPGRIKGSSGNE